MEVLLFAEEHKVGFLNIEGQTIGLNPFMDFSTSELTVLKSTT